jgi:hypothetical protein
MACFYKPLCGHQHLEIEVHLWNWRQGVRLLEFSCGTRARQDHPGYDLSITVMNLFLQIQVYDDRHWNQKADRFMTKEEQAAEADQDWKEFNNGNEKDR